MDGLAPKDWSSFSIALAGLMLGIYNLVRSVLKDQPKVKIYQPDGSFFPEASPGKPTILRIANCRNQPITILDAGFYPRDRDDLPSIAGRDSDYEPQFPITIPPMGHVDIRKHGVQNGVISFYSFDRLKGYWVLTAEGKRLFSKF